MDCKKHCEHGGNCKECEKTKGYMYESAIMRHEAHEKRLWQLIVIMIIIFMATNIAWLGYLCYRTSILDDLEINHVEETDTEETDTSETAAPTSAGEVL